MTPKEIAARIRTALNNKRAVQDDDLDALADELDPPKPEYPPGTVVACVTNEMKVLRFIGADGQVRWLDDGKRAAGVVTHEANWEDVREYTGTFSGMTRAMLRAAAQHWLENPAA